MKKLDYHTSIIADDSAHEAFEAINRVSQWWTENMEGSSQKPDDEFTVRFGDVHYSKQRLIEVVRDKKIVWLVTKSKLNFLKNKQEWNNTKISFEISTQNGQKDPFYAHRPGPRNRMFR